MELNQLGQSGNRDTDRGAVRRFQEKVGGLGQIRHLVAKPSDEVQHAQKDYKVSNAQNEDHTYSRRAWVYNASVLYGHNIQYNMRVARRNH